MSSMLAFTGRLTCFLFLFLTIGVFAKSFSFDGTITKRVLADGVLQTNEVRNFSVARRF